MSIDLLSPTVHVEVLVGGRGEACSQRSDGRLLGANGHLGIVEQRSYPVSLGS